MIERYGFFDSIDGDEREYTQVDFSRFGRSLALDGVRGGADALKVVPAATGLAVTLHAGLALVNGYHYELEDDGSGAMALSLDAAQSYTRYDRIVIRWNAAARTIGAYVLQGTETAPSITRNDEYYEISLAQVRVRVGATAITEDDVIDERTDAALCGLHLVGADEAAAAAAAARQMAEDAAKAAAVAQQTADGKVVRVNGKTGEVTLTASDVGALTASGTADNANKLGGTAASEYLKTAQVVNNLTTTSAGYVADARALKTLQDTITAGLEWKKLGRITGSGQTLTIPACNEIHMTCTVHSAAMGDLYCVGEMRVPYAACANAYRDWYVNGKVLNGNEYQMRMIKKAGGALGSIQATYAGTDVTATSYIDVWYR